MKESDIMGIIDQPVSKKKASLTQTQHHSRLAVTAVRAAPTTICRN